MGHYLKWELQIYGVISWSKVRPKPEFIVGLELNTTSQSQLLRCESSVWQRRNIRELCQTTALKFIPPCFLCGKSAALLLPVPSILASSYQGDSLSWYLVFSGEFTLNFSGEFFSHCWSAQQRFFLLILGICEIDCGTDTVLQPRQLM